MLRLVGILLLMTGCIGLGYNAVAEEKQRIRELREIRSIMLRIQNEMTYGKRTLPEICNLFGESGEEPYRTIFCMIFQKAQENDGATLERIWMEEMENGIRNLPLKREEKEILKSLPGHTGIADGNMQAAGIGQSLDIITGRIAQADTEYENKSRVIMSISVTAGLFLSILLL